MYRYASVVYFICFFLFVIFSRQPYYFEAEITPGKIVKATGLSATIRQVHKIKADDSPIIMYRVGSATYYLNGSDNSLLKLSAPTQNVQVIYDPGEPATAAVYQLAGYWIVLSELLFSIGGYTVLLLIAIGITGKTNNENDEEPQRPSFKYN